jgi:hypothetical protein
MCPLCITTAVLSAAGATSGAGAIGVVAGKWRTLQQWICGSWLEIWRARAGQAGQTGTRHSTLAAAVKIRVPTARIRSAP